MPQGMSGNVNNLALVNVYKNKESPMRPRVVKWKRWAGDETGTWGILIIHCFWVFEGGSFEYFWSIVSKVHTSAGKCSI